jgi:uncharacterized protein DUF1207/BON domain-containing protein
MSHPSRRRSRPAVWVFAIFGLAAAGLGPSSSPWAAGGAIEADARLQGYIEAWLIHVHGIDSRQVRVAVEDGVVTLSGTLESPEKIDLIYATVGSFEGVVSVVNRLEVGTTAPSTAPQGEAAEPPGATQGRWRSWRWWRQPPPGRKTVRFPVGDLFAGPLADQKQPRFHTTWQRWDTRAGHFNIGSVGFGENFGLVRWPRGREGDGWQVGISGAVFAIFNLDAASSDLLNADYIVGFPISYRSKEWSARMRLFHQSSHLGDEFLLMTQDQQPVPPATRINLSYEALELLGSWERRGLRAYGGGTRILSIEPDLERDRAQVGLEYRGNLLGWRTARAVAGLDVQAWDQSGWDRDKSFKAGFMFRSPYGDARSLQVLLEYYEGHAPHGQFFDVVVEYFALGIAYAF